MCKARSHPVVCADVPTFCYLSHTQRKPDPCQRESVAADRVLRAKTDLFLCLYSLSSSFGVAVTDTSGWTAMVRLLELICL